MFSGSRSLDEKLFALMTAFGFTSGSVVISLTGQAIVVDGGWLINSGVKG
ncbi:MAG: hypothetical protein L0387_05410 [Acidobacteria bacterium]|nr:hypothetical protein [Acidobacteriota bacterium]MCI0717751.1 hypothetical protein [Acidobacteriota bacterium]